MEQHHFAVSLSVGAKLLITLILFVSAVTGFFYTSSYFLLKDNRHSHKDEDQILKVSLIAKNIAKTAQKGLEVLSDLQGKLSSIPPLEADRQALLFKSLISDQHDVTFLATASLNSQSGALKIITETGRDDELHSNPHFEVKSDEGVELARDLAQKSFGYVKVLASDGFPYLGIAVTMDLQNSGTAEFPILIGIVPLIPWTDHLSGAHLTLASQTGRVLFSDDPALVGIKEKISNDPLFEAASKSPQLAGTREYEIQGKRFRGAFVNPGLGISFLSHFESEKSDELMRLFAEKFLLIGIMVFSSAAIVAVLFSKSLTTPLEALESGLQDLANGRTSENLPVHRGDEIGKIARSFGTASKKVQELIDSNALKARIESEALLSATVHENLIPPEEFRNESILLRSYFRPASPYSGNWWGYFGVDNKLAIMIGDASGQGAATALSTAAVRSCFSMIQKLAQQDEDFSFSPAAMLSFANRAVFDTLGGGIQMSFFLAALDFGNNVLTYSNAGHDGSWLFRRQDEGFAFSDLIASGQNLGVSRDYDGFEEKTIDFGTGDVLFLYSTGLSDAIALGGEVYGKDRLRSIAEMALPSGPGGIIQNIVEDFWAFHQSKPLENDITLASALLYPPDPMS